MRFVMMCFVHVHQKGAALGGDQGCYCSHVACPMGLLIHETHCLIMSMLHVDYAML